MHITNLKTVTAFGLLAYNVHHRVDQLSPFSVVPLGPVVPSARLPENEVVRTEHLPERPRTNAVHSPWLQVDKYSTRDVLPAVSLVVVDGDALQLQRRVALVLPSRVDAMFVGDDLPKLAMISNCLKISKS